MKTKAKTKGNLKGKSGHKKKNVRIKVVDYYLTTAALPTDDGTKEFVMSWQLFEERLRRIIREELDKTTTITLSDFLGNAHEKMGKNTQE